MTGQHREGKSAGGLRGREFRRLWIGESTSAVGNAVTSVAVPLAAVVTLHASTFLVGVLYAVEWLPWLALGLPAGALVDRWQPRIVMITCDVVSLMALGTVPVSAWLGVLTVTQLLLVAVAAGTASVFFTTAYNLMLPAVVNNDDLIEANTKLQASRSVANVTGPGLAGALAQLAGAVAGVALDTATFAISAVCLLRIQPRSRPSPPRERPHLLGEIRAGLRFVASDPYLRTLTLFGTAANLCLTGWQAVEILFLIRVIHVGSGEAGALLAAISAGGLAGAAITRRVSRRLGTARALLLVLNTTVPFGLLVPLGQPGWRLALLVVGGAMVSAGLVTANVIIRSFRQNYCPPALLGRLTATMNTLAYGAIPLGALLAGTLATLTGTRDALWAMTGGLVLSAAVLFAGPIRHTRQLPDHPPLTDDGGNRTAPPPHRTTSSGTRPTIPTRP